MLVTFRDAYIVTGWYLTHQDKPLVDVVMSQCIDNGIVDEPLATHGVDEFLVWQLVVGIARWYDRPWYYPQLLQRQVAHLLSCHIFSHVRLQILHLGVL